MTPALSPPGTKPATSLTTTGTRRHSMLLLPLPAAACCWPQPQSLISCCSGPMLLNSGLILAGSKPAGGSRCVGRAGTQAGAEGQADCCANSSGLNLKGMNRHGMNSGSSVRHYSLQTAAGMHGPRTGDQAGSVNLS